MFRRIQSLREKLRAEQLDGILIAPSASMQYLLEDASYPWQRTPDTGFFLTSETPDASGHFLNKPDCILYIPAQGEETLYLTKYRAAGMQHIPIRKVENYYVMLGEALARDFYGRRVACGESCYPALCSIVREIAPSAETVPGEHLVEQMRKVKDAGEIEAMRRVARFTDAALEYVVPYLKAGVTARQVEGLLASFGLEHGVQDISFTPTVRFVHPSMPNAHDIDAASVSELLVPGSSISFDFGYVIGGYSSDFGRSFCLGKAPQQLLDAYKALQYAQTELLKTIRPGMPIGMTFNFLRDRLAERGWDKNMRRYGDMGLIGHQIGVDVHERPWLYDDSPEVFTPGMVMCIEPKIWIPGAAYLRVEDMVLITEDGCESLTTFDRELFELL